MSNNKTVEYNLQKALAPYIIAPALPVIINWLERHSVNVSFSENKGQTLGYYVKPGGFGHQQKRHYISIQISLNPYLLLFVFVHEWAHLVVRLNYPQASAHGKEWKTTFTNLMRQFLREDIFPKDILAALRQFFIKSKATIPQELMDIFSRYGENRKEYIAIYKQAQSKGLVLPSPRTKPAANTAINTVANYSVKPAANLTANPTINPTSPPDFRKT
ncbi:MAG: SprT-like domain-containing protein [Bacteroidales bacterium]|jgi:hypothetical protein|nr:SprT-like domain-containing protein [Bacteroidales bacterium]